MADPIILTVSLGQGDRELCIVTVNVTELIERLFCQRDKRRELADATRQSMPKKQRIVSK